jgi:hypothetical protein
MQTVTSLGFRLVVFLIAAATLGPSVRVEIPARSMEMAANTTGQPALPDAPAGQPSKILDGVQQIYWGTTPCLCFVGSVVSSLQYLGEDLTGDYAMGVSGGAFKDFWIPPWDGGNCDLLMIGDEPIRRTFAALGYGHTLIRIPDGAAPAQVKDGLQPLIVSQIDSGKPVIAIGVVGPPEACVITGYEQGGDVLRGWSYFQENRDAYFRSDNWFENCYGIILIGEKIGAPSPRQVLQDALEWAIALIRVPEHPRKSATKPRLISGIAAYEAMAQALEREEEWQFTLDDAETMQLRCFAISNDGVHLLQCERAVAARFLDTMAEQDLPGADDLRKAAAIYRQEVTILTDASKLAPFSFAPDEERRKLLDPDHRRQLARLVREAKACEESAVEHLERAHQALTAAAPQDTE